MFSISIGADVGLVKHDPATVLAAMRLVCVIITQFPGFAFGVPLHGLRVLPKGGDVVLTGLAPNSWSETQQS